MQYIKEMQTTEARRNKYQFCRAMGKNSSWSRAMRDWHWSRIFMALGIPPAEQPDVKEEWKPEYERVAEEVG